MTTAAPRISRQLLESIERLDDRRLPIAETVRRVGSEADRLRLTRPSYEQIRIYVHERRSRNSGPSTAEIMLDVALRLRPPEALLDHLSGAGVRPLRL